MGNGGLHVAQVGGDGEQPGGVDKAPGGLAVAPAVAVFHFNGDHRAERFLLALGQGFLRVAVEAGIVHPGDARLLLQPLRQLQGVFRMRLHAQAQGFQTLEKHPGVERAHAGAGGTDEPVDLLEDLFGTDHGAAQAAALPVQIFGGAVNHQVRTQFQRFLQRRGAEAVINDQQRAVVMGQFGQRFDVAHFRERVGRRFQIQQLGFRANRRAPLIQIVQIDQGGVDVELLQIAVVDHIGGAEHAA